MYRHTVVVNNSEFCIKLCNETQYHSVFSTSRPLFSHYECSGDISENSIKSYWVFAIMLKPLIKCLNVTTLDLMQTHGFIPEQNESFLIHSERLFRQLGSPRGVPAERPEVSQSSQ